MTFRSKVDRFYANFILIVGLIIGVATFLPLFFEEIRNEFVVFLILTTIYLIIMGLILWTVFSIKYVFSQDYLLVKGGPFRSRILYENIKKVLPTTSIFIGYRIMSARDGIEIFYENATLGSVKISPKNKEEFIAELKQRCPNLQYYQ
ncbi:PH domain-containing protein [Paraliobacillus sp. JSM ZJ581]|uniref:PH domain-containing protein n=1 Tax=Paraliobacillus sp. JSM ZJ581 TaxID=3342118 RepID=UPI0035A92538